MAEKKAHCSVIPCNYDDDSFAFISYAHQDAGTVFPIIERIAAEGYALWYDRGIAISSTWTDEIAIAIKRCKAFVLFISKNAVNSQYVRAEIEFALNNKTKVIPVYLDGIDVLPPGLALGLNATQGITDIDTPQFVANQICNALIYNKVARKDGQEAVYTPIEHTPKKSRTPWMKYLAGGALATALILAAVLFSGAPDENTVAPQQSVSAPTVAAPGAPVPKNVNPTIPAPEGIATPQPPQVQVQVPKQTPVGKTLTLEKSTFVPVEPVFLTLSKLTPEMIAKGVILTLSNASDPQGKYQFHRLIEKNDIDPANPQAPLRIKLHAPEQAGRYEVRLYGDDKNMSLASLIGSAAFTVQGNSRNAFTIALEKTTFVPGENIQVQVSGIPKRMIEDRALVGLFRKNPKRGDYIIYEPARDRDMRMGFNAPSEPGEYEIQAHINNQILDAPTLVSRIEITVHAPTSEDAQ
ncbi:hypothetical protein FACS189441_1780 [Betaproteobacteria bacterium]|nr:hypothetical protein FACS189441_1780 [Betaproteobacteria bacterium]